MTANTTGYTNQYIMFRGYFYAGTAATVTFSLQYRLTAASSANTTIRNGLLNLYKIA